ncbi:MAG TPA: TonB family protein [Longimicrobiaceae bacterium]|nr:TonB family protein [Longimicrobiaceae bacterium]
MFNKLVASQGKGRTATNKTIVASVVVHALLIGGAVYASSQIPAVQEKAQELVTYMQVKPEPPAPKPAEPPPPPPEQKVSKPPPPKGFQALTPPKAPPPEIPDINTDAPPVDPKDFTGLGNIGGTHNGVQGGVPQSNAPTDSSNFAYEAAVLDAAPQLENAGQLQSVMQRLYPRMLQDAGISGSTMLQFVIEKDGSVDESTVKVISASNDQFADPAVKAITRARFSPGRYKGKAVRTLVQIPITWKPAH